MWAGLCPPLQRPWGPITPPWRPPPMAAGRRLPSGARASCPLRAARRPRSQWELPAGRIAGRRPRQRSRPGKRGLGCRPADATHDGGRGAAGPSTRCTALTPGPSPEGRGETGGCPADRRADRSSFAAGPHRRAPPRGLEQRLRRLEAVGEIASQWNQVREIEPLLVANGRGGHAAVGSGSGEHLSLGPAEPHIGRPARAGHPRRRIAHPRRSRRGGRGDPQRPTAPPRCRPRTGGHRPQRRRAAPLSDAHAAVRSAPRPVGRVVRRVRVDQQAFRHVHEG